MKHLGFCLFFIHFFLCQSQKITAQTLGGQTVFNFLQLPNTAKLSALGGTNISSIQNNVGNTFQSPALLNNQHDGEIDFSFNQFLAGIKNISISYGFLWEKKDLMLNAGLLYINYGNITQTDASGNILGNFRVQDALLQLQASKQFTNFWRMGLTTKFITSQMAGYNSNGLAFDVGLLYNDSSNGFSFGLTVKNIGTQLKTYIPNSPKTELPFDVQFGATKKLANAPLKFSITITGLQSLSNWYNNVNFNTEIGNDKSENSILQKIINRTIIATEIIASNKLNFSLSYNLQTRANLNVYNSTNGLSGFSGGFSFATKKFWIHYGGGLMQQKMFHSLSVSLPIKDWL